MRYDMLSYVMLTCLAILHREVRGLFSSRSGERHGSVHHPRDPDVSCLPEDEDDYVWVAKTQYQLYAIDKNGEQRYLNSSLLDCTRLLPGCSSVYITADS